MLKAPRLLRLSLLMAVLSLFAAADASAQGNLLNKGRDLLGKLGVSPAAPTELGEAEIGDGLRQALRVGTEQIVGALGTRDGYNGDVDVHIPLPGALKTVQSTLGRVGLSRLTDDLELRLNRAAETAAPHAKALFFKAIADMTLDDTRGILKGPDDAATRFLQDRMAQPLTARFAPIIDQELAAAGAVQAYDRVVGEYKRIPFVPDAKADLTTYVVERALDGLFLFLAREEAAIRENPAKRTTELLQRVFGAGV